MHLTGILFTVMKTLSKQYLIYMKPYVVQTQHLSNLVMSGIKKEFHGYDPVTGKNRLAAFLEEFRHLDYVA